MFDLAWSELLIIAVVAILVVGPKDLPRLMKGVGEWVGKARRMASHFQAGVDEMIRQAELEDLKKDLNAIRRDVSAVNAPIKTGIQRTILPPTTTTPPPSKMVAMSADEIVDSAGSAPPAPLKPEADARTYIDPPPPPAAEPEPAKGT